MDRLINEFRDVHFSSKNDPFETLFRAIVGQQISVKAADAVCSRIEENLNGISTANILSSNIEQLRSFGLSKQKASYIIDLANHFNSGSIDQDNFKNLDDDALQKKLCSIRGIGKWTAEMFLIFHLQRRDIFPIQDIGLIRALERHYLNGSKVSTHELMTIGERFRPWRTVATWYLWRSLDPYPVAY
jgi:DNA-3-methyladenine glycosylase II